MYEKYDDMQKIAFDVSRLRFRFIDVVDAAKATKQREAPDDPTEIKNCRTKRFCGDERKGRCLSFYSSYWCVGKFLPLGFSILSFLLLVLFRGVILVLFEKRVKSFMM